MQNIKIKERRLTNGLEKAKNHALTKGGECLSAQCITTLDKLEWTCHNEMHPSWRATYGGVINRGNWCRQCSIKSSFPKEKYLKIAQENAISKGGLCLSNEYKNNRTKMEWKCSNIEHKSWFSVYSAIISADTWCPECGIEKSANAKKLKEGLKNIQDYAQIRGGVCLSNHYHGIHDEIICKCKDVKHKPWSTSYASLIYNKNWCPECSGQSNYQEFIVRKILNYLFNTNFIKTRKLEWNKNSKTGRLLELDGFCDNLKIAFEFQGRQHYYIDTLYTQNEDQLEYIKYKDKCKVENCLINNVKLIVVDELSNNKNYTNFFNNILIGIKNAGLQIPYYDIKELERVYFLNPESTPQEDIYQKCLDYALSKNGQCLSTKYVSNITKMEWKCSNFEHNSWFCDYAHIVGRNRWCPECAKEKRAYNTKISGLLSANEYAKTKDGKCLSNQYVNVYSVLEWKCSNQNHPSWLSSYSSIIKHNLWCKECTNKIKIEQRRLDGLAKANEYAILNGGKCLSNQYLNTKNKLEWKCSNPEHPSWFSIYEHVISRSQWCSKCRK